MSRLLGVPVLIAGIVLLAMNRAFVARLEAKITARGGLRARAVGGPWTYYNRAVAYLVALVWIGVSVAVPAGSAQTK